MVNIKNAVTRPPQQIIKHAALSLLRYDDYQAIYRATLLSWVVEVDLWLGEHCDFFGFRWAIFEDPPRYDRPIAVLDQSSNISCVGASPSSHVSPFAYFLYVNSLFMYTMYLNAAGSVDSFEGAQPGWWSCSNRMVLLNGLEKLLKAAGPLDWCRERAHNS